MTDQADKRLPCAIRPLEQARVRRCGECGADMKIEACWLHSSPWLFHDRFLHFSCADCGAEARLLDGESFSLRLVILLLILGSAITMATQGGFSFMLDLLLDGSLLSLLGLFYAALSLIFAMTAWTTFMELVHDIRARFHHPRAKGCSGLGRFIKTVLLGLTPWIIAIGFGYYDFYVHDIHENVAFLLIAVVFAPVFSAHHFGLSAMGTFLATVLWLPLLLLIGSFVR